MSDKDFPESFFCPLTQALMENPVMDPEGNTYERAAILEWLSKNPTSPITRTPLSMTQLIPNRALRDSIEHRRKELDPNWVPASSTPSAQPATSSQAASPPSASSSDALVALSLSASSIATPNGDETVLLATLTPQNGLHRVPVDLVCVVDVSGSMQIEATVKSATGVVESDGLSILDIVKHSVRTIVNVLGPNDRLALVSYSTTAHVVLGLTTMDAAGQSTATAALSNLEADGQTNLWAGLSSALELVQRRPDVSRSASVFLLTDGCPNVNPPRGIIQSYARWLATNPQAASAPAIHTFGFGYKMDSTLMSQLALLGRGAYTFIPDSNMVGTAFVNALGNQLTVLGDDVKLSIVGASVLDTKQARGGYALTRTGPTTTVDVGVLHYGQPRSVVLRVSQPRLSAVASVRIGARTFEVSAELDGLTTPTPELHVQLARLALVDMISQCVSNCPTIREEGDVPAPAAQVLHRMSCDVESACELLRASPANADPRVAALLEDARGQCREAVQSETAYCRWGAHYLPSLGRAHQLQICNNFKDPGVQLYGGELFRQLRDTADDIFCRLPAPRRAPARFAPTGTASKPSSTHTGGGGARGGGHGSSTSPPPRPAPSMHRYNDRSNGCIAGNCRVLMSDGSSRRVDHVRRGDVVATTSTANGGSARVLCVVKFTCADGFELCKLDGGLLITPYHPVRPISFASSRNYNNNNNNNTAAAADKKPWAFPSTLAPAKHDSLCTTVFSFLLHNNNTTTKAQSCGGDIPSYAPSMIVDGWECVALAHGITDDAVAQHDFWGSARVAESLEAFEEFAATGVVCPRGVVREPVHGLVCGLF